LLRDSLASPIFARCAIVGFVDNIVNDKVKTLFLPYFPNKATSVAEV